MTALLAFVASGQLTGQQALDRIFYFAHTETAQDAQEITRLIRSITDIQQASLDSARGSLTLRGTADQIALAEWLFSEIDQPTQRQQNSAVREYQMSGAGENVARAFYFAHVETPRDLQEIATLIRSITEIRRLFVYNTRQVLALRGTADQIAMAEWLFDKLDQPANRPSQHSASEYRAPAASDDVARVFYFAHAETSRDLQEIATLIRSIAEIRRVFTYEALRVVTLRGTSGQIAMAEWMFNELDQQRSAAQQSQNPGPHEYQAPGGSDDLLRVFYLTHVQGVQDLQRIAAQVRAATQIRRLYAYDPEKALALRGTIDQITTAERVIQELDKAGSVAAR